MNIRKTVRDFTELNAPSGELMDNTLHLMREAEETGQETSRRHSGWRRFRIAAGTMAAAMVLLIGANLAFPAFAESLPFVGSVFRFINDRGHRYTESMDTALDRISDYAVDVSLEEGSTIVVPAAASSERDMTVQLKEIYYDGNFVFAGLAFQMDLSEEPLMEIDSPNYSVRINGELLDWHKNGFFDLGDYLMTKLPDGSYVTQKAFRVPDDLQGADTLEIELSFSMVFDKFGTIINSTDFTLPFTVQKNTVSTREISCDGMEMNGVRLVAAATSPAVTYLCVEYPETYKNPACGAVFEDGINIGGFGEEDFPAKDGIVRKTQAYAGLPESETRSVVWRLFDKNGSNQTEAVFVIDFANGAVRLGSEEDVKEPPRGDYACGVEATQNLQDGMIVEKFHADQDKTMLYLAVGSENREELTAEIWQDGVLLDSVNIRHDPPSDTSIGYGYDNYSENFPYWEYGDDGSIPDRIPGTEHTVIMVPVRNSYVGLDLNRPLTVRVYDLAGELVLNQEITLEVHED